MDGSWQEIQFYAVIFNCIHLFEGSMKKKFLETFIIDSNKALELKLGRPIFYSRFQNHDACAFITVRKIEDAQDDSTTFHPEMSHQIFGET